MLSCSGVRLFSVIWLTIEVFVKKPKPFAGLRYELYVSSTLLQMFGIRSITGFRKSAIFINNIFSNVGLLR